MLELPVHKSGEENGYTGKHSDELKKKTRDEREKRKEGDRGAREEGKVEEVISSVHDNNGAKNKTRRSGL